MMPDRSQLRKLWADTFEDSEGYLDIFFDTYYRSALILTEERSGSVISALWGLPFDFTGGLKGLYLCGLATRPEWRGKGIMSRLMSLAEEWAVRNNFDFSFLIPAGEALRRYYCVRGYHDALSRTTCKLTLPEPSQEEHECSIDDLMALERSVEKKTPCRPCIIHNLEDWNAVLRESHISGGKIFCSQIFDSRGKRKIDAVAFGEKVADQEPMKIVKVIGEAETSEKLLASIGAEAGEETPYGMWKPLSEAALRSETPDFYLLLD